MATLPTSRRLGVLLFFFATLFSTLRAQDCAHTTTLSQGYTTSISSVTLNGNGSYTIVLTVINTGCATCKKLNAFTVQAAPGTYSNVSVAVLYGPFSYANISMGPTLSGTTVTGFRINNTNGMGNGQASAFRVTYTVTSLQNQQLILKTSSVTVNNTFTIADFQAVLTCQTGVIFPYFDPYANKSYDIIGVELRSLYQAYVNNGSYISDDIFQIIGNSVRISIRTKPGQHANAVALLTTAPYGLVQELDDPVNNLINGTFPILNLLSLNQLPNLLVSARPIYAALHNVGLITSQGDTALRSFRARGVFGVDGQGVKVGVISDSYNTILGNPAADDVQRKDLPGVTNPDHPTPVQVLQDYPFGTRSDEGRAMLQIVHDVAPGADLAFRTGFLGSIDMANGIKGLQQAGCNVIVDDVSYISEPFFRDGVIAQAVDQVKALGVSYFSAAGNFGTNSWEGQFAPAAAPSGVVGQAHNFASGGGTDILQSVTLYQGDYTVVFQWDDGTPGNTTNSDFDIYLAGNNGNLLFGFNRMNVGGDGMEILPFTVTADSVQSNIAIIRETGTGSAFLKYVVYRGHLRINEYSGLNASTLTGQANAAGAMAVGAVLYTNTPEYSGVTPTPASFSSRGGTPVNGVNRSKPDFCAPNGVNTSVNLGGVNYDGDAFPNFFGTSAAAPHAAGVAALLMQAKTKYYGSTLTPNSVKSILQTTALNMGAPGYDAASGAGFILADSALKSLANPAPYITSLEYDTTLTPGLDTLVLTIHGEYLNALSTVWFDGAPLNNGVVVQGTTAIVTTIYPFSALYPAIQVRNQPRPGTNGLDGGLSNALYFTTKESILITVANKSKKYGEVMPAFTATYTKVNVDGSTPLSSAGLTAAEMTRIQGIGLTSVATTLSNVGLWAITTNATDPLSPNSNAAVTDPLDISLLQRYNIVVHDGLLTIDPAELTITPRDTTFVYGQPIVGLKFNYVFNDANSGVIMNATDRTTVQGTVTTAHGTALVNTTGVVRGTALVNNNGDQLLTAAQLNNFSLMISQNVATTRGTALVNGTLIDPAELYYSTVLTNATEPARSVRGTALVNAYGLVRGTALVNKLDTLGNIINSASLTNSTSLVNNSGLLNSSTITLNSNTQTLVILGDQDIKILSGDSTGDVVIRSVNLVTGDEVGTHLSVPGTFLTNNFNVHYGLGHVTILPAPAQFTIAANTLTQTYNGAPKSVGVTVVPAGVPYTVTYNGSTTLPVNAGTYAVHVAVNSPNYVGSADATLVIQKATAQIIITPSSLTQVYSATPKSVSVSVVPNTITPTVTYNGSATLPVNAGSYAVVVTVNNPNYVGSANATLVIQKAPATATTGTYVINKGAALPAFTATYSGFLAGQTASVVTSVNFSTSPNYTTNSPAGVYQIIVNATAANYTFTSINGTLYVNPSGPGTKQVKPNFVCSEILSTPVNGYSRIAHFTYENQNATAVYIPIGPNNQITGAPHDGSQQPTVFQPGGGSILVPYNTTAQITWQITSNKNTGGTGSIPANSSNVVCTATLHSMIAPDEDASVEGTGANIRVYPNPSFGKVFLEFPEGQAAGTSLEVYNALGSKCAVNIDRPSDQLMELDLSSFGKGMYIINTINEGNVTSFRVIVE